MEKDLAFFNGTIWSDGRLLGPRWGMLCRDGKIWQIGSDARLKKLLTREFEAYDLEGKLVLPGFIDSHLHLVSLGYALGEADLEPAASEAEAAAIVGAHAGTKAEGEWVFGRGWHSNEWPGGGFPTSGSLDAAVPGAKVYLRSRCCHSLWVSSAAMAEAGIDRNTVSPPGGEIVKDSAGEPTGVLLEGAMELLAGEIPEPDLPIKIDAARRAIGHLHEFGITGCVVCAADDAMAASQALDSMGALQMRILSMPSADQLDSVADIGLRPGFGSDCLSLGPIKVFLDGSLGSRTAAMFDEYPDGSKGMLIMEQAELEGIISKANGAGWPVAVHAIGDRAVATALDAFEAAGDRRLRNRIEHCQCIREEDVPRFKELRIIASIQPVHLLCDRVAAEDLWGESAKRSFPFISLRGTGANLALGSDAPVASADPFVNIHAAVNRTPLDSGEAGDPWIPDQRLPLEEALFGYAEGSAYAAGWEHRRGRLVPGYDADMVVLSESPFGMPLCDLSRIRASATVVDGTVVFMSGD